MADNTENQQPNTNPEVLENKFTHEASVQVGCSTGIHELEITKLNPGQNGMTEVLMMCRRCGQNFVSQEKLNLNDVLGGSNETVQQPVPQQAQPVAPAPQPLPQRPAQQQPSVQPITPMEAFKDEDSFWESIKRGGK